MTEKTVVAVIIIDRGGNIVLQDRKGFSKYGEEWSFFGGHIEDTETIIQTAMREASEELDITLPETIVHYIGSTVHFLNERNIKYTRHLCIVTVVDCKNLHLTDHESAGIGIVHISQLDSLKFNTNMEQEQKIIAYHLKFYAQSYDFHNILS